MKNWAATSIVLLILVFIESSLTSLPLVFLFLLTLAISEKKQWIFIASFLSGIILDLLRLGVLGQTSLFFIIFFFVVLLYDKKFDIQTFPFVLISSFVGSLLYLLIFGYNQILEQAAVSALIAIIFFKGAKTLGFVTEKQVL